MRIGSRAVKNKKRSNKQPEKELTRKELYQKYLHSADWKERRDAFREAYGNKCMFCRKESDLHIHHLNYNNIGDETINDVVCLCKGCHLKVHRGKIVIFMFTPEELEHFKAIADIVCPDESIEYIAKLKK